MKTMLNVLEWVEVVGELLIIVSIMRNGRVRTRR